MIISPFGRDTEMPLFVGQMSRSTAASGRAIKLPVVPVSAFIEWVETEDNDCWSDKLYQRSSSCAPQSDAPLFHHILSDAFTNIFVFDLHDHSFPIYIVCANVFYKNFVYERVC